MPIQFVDSLPKKEFGYKGIAEELRERPGQWAVIAAPSSENLRKGESTQRFLREGRSPYMPLTEYEVQLVNGLCYARYLGNGDEE